MKYKNTLMMTVTKSRAVGSFAGFSAKDPDDDESWGDDPDDDGSGPDHDDYGSESSP